MSHQHNLDLIDAMAMDAMRRLSSFINRSAGQHGHHIRVGFQMLRVQMGVA